MPWAKFDDQYYDHSKIVEVGPIGMALHTAATCYCARHLTDGFVPMAMLPRLINLDGLFIMRNGVSNAVTNEYITNELIRVGLFDKVPGGIMVHDYLEYNPLSEKILAEREATKQRQKKWRDEHRDDNGKYNGVTNALVTPTPYPYPSPSPSLINGGGGEICEDNLSQFARLYESEIGALSPMISDELQELCREYPLSWFQEAVKVTVNGGSRNLNYTKSVLSRWKKDGFKTPLYKEKNYKPKQEYHMPEDYERA